MAATFADLRTPVHVIFDDGGVPTAVSNGKPMPTTGAGGSGFIPSTRGSLTNRSGTITTGGSSQTLAAANATRNYLFVQNLSAGDLWIDFGAAAVQSQPSIKLLPDASFVMEGTFISNQLISIVGAATGQEFSAKEG